MSGRSRSSSRRSRSSATSRKKAARSSRVRFPSADTLSPSSPYRRTDRQRQYKSEMAGLHLPVARIKAMLKVHNYAPRVSDKAAVFLTSVLEYVAVEIIELSSNAARSSGKRRIKPKYINRVLKTDPELFDNFRSAHVMEGGFIPLQAEQLAASNGRASPPVPDGPSTSRGLTRSSRSRK